MNTGIVCEKFMMDIPDQVDGDPWFLDWAARSPKQVSNHITAGYHAYAMVGAAYDPDVDIVTVREYFGGVGAQSLIIQDMFHPKAHRISDYSPASVKHLEGLMRSKRGVACIQADAYDLSFFSHADLVGLDFGDLTVWKTRDGEKHRKLLDRVFVNGRPKAVVLTDIAARYLHLHRERYETVLGAFGSCSSYEKYLEAFALRLQAIYGYQLVAGFGDRWSTVMTFVPEEVPTEQFGFQAIPEKPIGLTITDL